MQRMDAIVTRPRPDCWGSLFRGAFSFWEPMEPSSPCREGELPGVILGKDVPWWIALHDRSQSAGAQDAQAGEQGLSADREWPRVSPLSLRKPRPDRPRPESDSPATDGDALHRRTGSRPPGPPPAPALSHNP